MTPGDRLLLYTDGVSESLAGDDDLGEQALLTAASQHADNGGTLLDLLLQRVQERLEGSAQSDDLTLLTATLLHRRRELARED
jgi:serine phosphatase RsbU (regulator of sigma subunit)